MEVKIEDLEWFEYNPSMLFGKDKNGNEYGINSKGNVVPVLKHGAITLDMHGTHIDAVKQLIERKKLASKVA